MKKVLLCIAVVLLFTRCNKEPELVIQQIPDYFPLSVGNYWIYDHYEVMETGGETLTGSHDSIYIEKDTLIGSEVYFVIKGSSFLCGHYFAGMNSQIIRDSAGYLINTDGSIYMSSVNFTEQLNEFADIQPNGDTLYTGSYSMQVEPSEVSVPAGEFHVINCRVRITVYDADPKIDRYSNNLYAEDVGEVLDEYFFLHQTDRHFEKRLVRYHIAEE